MVLLSGGSVEGHLNIPDVWFGEANFAGPAEVDHGGLVTNESDLAVFQDELPAFAGDLEAVGPGRFAGRSDEYAGGTIRPFKVSGHVILDFDVVKAAQLA